MKKYSEQLIFRLKELIKSERKITAEIIELIREVDQKRTYLDYGHTSMFGMLTNEFGYTPSAAMRRIDAARLSKEIPEIKESLKTGEINLSQVSLLAQAVRQKQKEQTIKEAKPQISKETKVFLLEQVKSLDLVETQKVFASRLDLEIKNHEKKSFQKDESVRLEVTLSKAQFDDLERVKQLISHQHPNPSVVDLIEFLTNNFLDKKDPLRQKTNLESSDSNGSLQKASLTNELKRDGAISADCKEKAYAATVVETRQTPAFKYKSTPSKTVPLKRKQMIFKRDQSCQWEHKTKDPSGNAISKKCGSRFQLQVDHKIPKWQNGGHEPSNLQLLCGVHNRLKYRHEIIGRI